MSFEELKQAESQYLMQTYGRFHAGFRIRTRSFCFRHRFPYRKIAGKPGNTVSSLPAFFCSYHSVFAAFSALRSSSSCRLHTR